MEVRDVDLVVVGDSDRVERTRERERGHRGTSEPSDADDQRLHSKYSARLK
jgi:hypothetical protein